MDAHDEAGLYAALHAAEEEEAEAYPPPAGDYGTYVPDYGADTEPAPLPEEQDEGGEVHWRDDF